MRFGLFVPQGWRLDLAGVEPAKQWPTMLDLARHAEAGPWESLWVYDHFHTVPEPIDEATHEAWSLMAALGAVTSRIRLGQMCTCMSYRNPAYLAKVAATVDVISGGRVEMGIGGGWYEHDWRAYGYGFPSAGERVTLRLAARYADYTNFDASPQTFRHKSEVLARHCREVGREFDEITRSGNDNVVIGGTERDVGDRLEWIRAHYASIVPRQAAATVASFRSGPAVGTPEQIVETLRRQQTDGMTYAIAVRPGWGRSTVARGQPRTPAGAVRS